MTTIPSIREPSQRTGFLVLKVYGVNRDGTRHPIPPQTEPKDGECIVPGCDCGGVTDAR